MYCSCSIAYVYILVRISSCIAQVVETSVTLYLSHSIPSARLAGPAQCLPFTGGCVGFTIVGGSVVMGGRRDAAVLRAF